METKRARHQSQHRPATSRRGRVAAARGTSGAPAREAGRGSIAATARALLDELGVGALPHVAVRFWDGSELPANGDTAATVLVRDPEAVAHLVHAPRQLGLARAWVKRLIDVDGDLEAVLRARGAFEGVHVSAAARARVALTAVRLAGGE